MAEKGSLTEHALKTAIGAVVLAIVGAVIVTFVPILRHFLFESIPSSARHLGHWLAVPVVTLRWIYWTLVLAFILVVIRFISRFWKSPAVELTFNDYVQDTFAGVVWRWNWHSHSLDQCVTPYCPECDRLLTADYNPDYGGACKLKCDVHGVVSTFQESPQSIVQRVVREIDVKVRSGSWLRPGKSEKV